MYEFTTDSEAYYDQDDRIPAIYTPSYRAAYGGYLPLPTAGTMGECQETNYVEYERPVYDNVCVRAVSDVADECTVELDLGRFTTDLLVGISASSSSSSGSSSAVVDEFVQVELRDVVFSSYLTGAESAYTSFDTDSNNTNCRTYFEYVTSNATTTTTTTSTTNASSSSNSTNTTSIVEDECVPVSGRRYNVGGWCRNAIKSVCYIITHDGSGSIVSVEADLTLTDIPTGNSTSEEDDDEVGLLQEYTVEFLQSNAVSRDAQTSGNVVNRTRSGNPGYIVGLPVLSGIVVEDSSSSSSAAVRARVPGLQVLSSVVNLGDDASASDDGSCLGVSGYDSTASYPMVVAAVVVVAAGAATEFVA